MEKDPAKRIQSAAEVAERLEPWSAATMEFIDRPIDRRSWTPPPPPKEPAPVRELGDDGEGAQTGFSGALSQSGTVSDQDLPSAMQPELGTESDATLQPIESVSLDPALKKNESSSLLLPIALTLAIAIPVSLLVGAIIGYLIRESM